MEVLLILIVIAALLIVWQKRRKKSTVSGKSDLFQKYCQKMRLPPDKAREQLDAHIQRLQVKYPGRSEEWYLDKILYDLERDRG